jgi:hypothetical protein
MVSVARNAGGGMMDMKDGGPAFPYCKWLEKVCDDLTDQLIKIEEAVNGQD